MWIPFFFFKPFLWCLVGQCSLGPIQAAYQKFLNLAVIYLFFKFYPALNIFSLKHQVYFKSFYSFQNSLHQSVVFWNVLKTFSSLNVTLHILWKTTSSLSCGLFKLYSLLCKERKKIWAKMGDDGFLSAYPIRLGNCNNLDGSTIYFLNK
jgi:hypothetical protein